MAAKVHAHRHAETDHHVGPCDAACRAGRRAHGHLYRGRGVEEAQLASFRARYGADKGAYVYGATVGKVKREQATEEARLRRENAHLARSPTMTVVGAPAESAAARRRRALAA